MNGLGLEEHIVNGPEAGPTQTIVVVLYNLNKHNKIIVLFEGDKIYSGN